MTWHSAPSMACTRRYRVFLPPRYQKFVAGGTIAIMQEACTRGAEAQPHSIRCASPARPKEQGEWGAVGPRGTDIRAEPAAIPPHGNLLIFCLPRLQHSRFSNARLTPTLAVFCARGEGVMVSNRSLLVVVEDHTSHASVVQAIWIVCRRSVGDRAQSHFWGTLYGYTSRRTLTQRT